MDELDPATHAVTLRGHARFGTERHVVDGRIKPGHDGFAGATA